MKTETDSTTQYLLIPETVNVRLPGFRALGRVGRCVHQQLLVEGSWRETLARTVYFNCVGSSIDSYPPILVAGTSERGKAAFPMWAMIAREARSCNPVQVIDVGIRRRMHRLEHDHGVNLEAVVPWETAMGYSFVPDKAVVLYNAVTGELVRKLRGLDLPQHSTELLGLPNGNHVTVDRTTRSDVVNVYLRPVIHTKWWAKSLKPGDQYDPAEDLQTGIPHIPRHELPNCKNHSRGCNKKLRSEDLWAAEMGVRHTRYCRSCLPSGSEGDRSFRPEPPPV